MVSESSCASGARGAWRQVLLAVALVLLTVLAYQPALRGGFLWDDYSLLLNNRLIHAPDGLGRFWFTTEAEDYFPLTYSTLWGEWRLFGKQAAGYHAVNLLLHALSAGLLWRVLRRLKAPGAWLAGAVFAVHPVAVASAAWISETKNTLSLTLCLLALLTYLKAEQVDDASAGHPAPPHLSFLRFSAFLLFLLALLAKSSLVMLPPVLLLCAWWRRGRLTRKDLLRTLPYFAASLLLGLATIWFQTHNVIGGEIARPEGLASRIAATGWIAWFYLYKLLLPIHLCAIYPRWEVDPAKVLSWFPLIALLGVFAVLWAHRRGWGRAPLFALTSFLLLLLPAMGIVEMSFMKFSLVSDHLQYAAMIAPLALAAGGLAQVARRRGWIGGAGKAAAGGCVLALAILTWQRAGLYGDELRLWRDNLARNPAAWGAWSNLGASYVRAGRWDDAIECYDRMIELVPQYADGYYARAFALMQNDTGHANDRAAERAAALADATRAIRLKPTFAAAYCIRGSLYADGGRMEEALDDYDRAIALKPKLAEAYSLRGKAYARTGRLDAAVRDFGEAIALKPDSSEAYFDRAAAWMRLDRTDLAVADCSRVIALDPALAPAYYNRGNAYASGGRLPEALDDYNKAIALKPEFAAAYCNRGNVRYYLGEYEGALADVQMYEKLGGRPDPEFVKSLTAARAAKRPQR